MDRDQVICSCFSITVGQIEDEIVKGAKSFEEIQEITNVGAGCGACIDKSKELVNKLLDK